MNCPKCGAEFGVVYVNTDDGKARLTRRCFRCWNYETGGDVDLAAVATVLHALIERERMERARMDAGGQVTTSGLMEAVERSGWPK